MEFYIYRPNLICQDTKVLSKLYMTTWFLYGYQTSKIYQISYEKLITNVTLPRLEYYVTDFGMLYFLAKDFTKLSPNYQTVTKSETSTKSFQSE